MKSKKETMSKHFIYHIFGKKVGCTKNVTQRMYQQGIKEGEYEVLEEHTNAKTASVRERELQEQYGYSVDKIPYYKTLKNQKKSTTPEAIAKKVANTDYKASRAKIDWKAKVANTDYKAMVSKTDYKARTANTDYSKIDYKASRAKIDWKAAMKKRKGKIDYTLYSEKMSKAIEQYDLEGNFIKQWKSATEAKNKLGYKSSCTISSCLTGKQKTAQGYVWKYAN
jgi:hypothetical protein